MSESVSRYIVSVNKMVKFGFGSQLAVSGLAKTQFLTILPMSGKWLNSALKAGVVAG